MALRYEQGTKEHLYWYGILQVSADAPEVLRPTDVDRVMSEALERGELEGFRNWVLHFELRDRTRQLITDWTQED